MEKQIDKEMKNSKTLPPYVLYVIYRSGCLNVDIHVYVCMYVHATCFNSVHFKQGDEQA